MQMRLLVVVLGGLVSAFPVAAQQCSGGVNSVAWWNFEQRTGGNTVFAYTASEITGPDRDTFTLTLETGYQASSGPRLHRESRSSQLGAGVWHEYTYNLQQSGPGTFTTDSLHKASGVCGSGPPYAGWDGRASSSLTVERPIVTTSTTSGVMFLGGAVFSGSMSALMPLTASANDAPVSSAVNWRFLNPDTSYGMFTSNGSPFTYYQALRPASGCGVYDSLVVASFDGFDSEPFWIYNNAPKAVYRMWGGPWAVRAGIPPYGWQNDYTYKVLDLCGQPINWIDVNESFSQWFRPNADNWASWDPGSWGSGKFDQWGQFVDHLWETNLPGKFRPAMDANSNYVDESLQSVGLSVWQTFYGGATASGLGVYLRMSEMTHFLDHGKTNN